MSSVDTPQAQREQAQGGTERARETVVDQAVTGDLGKETKLWRRLKLMRRNGHENIWGKGATGGRRVCLERGRYPWRGRVFLEGERVPGGGGCSWRRSGFLEPEQQVPEC